MGPLRNALEPAAIVVIFTVGTVINRRKACNSRETADASQAPLLKDDLEGREYSTNVAHGERPVAESTTYSLRTIQSRILAFFPFLLEIVYWLLTYWIYQGLRALSAVAIRGNKGIFDTAERHALQILSIEHFLHIDVELSVQRFVLNRVPWLMQYLADVYYSHIVLGVAFLVYCYTFLPRGQYQSIRRTLALENVIAFLILTLWRCMPPRLLPEEYGFIDVLHNNGSGSTWTHNKFQLTIAAMPSLHFGNSVLIAFCLVRFSPHWFFRAIAPLWPMMMGFTIVATANHYILDAVVGVCVITTAYHFNRAMLCLLPIERVLFRLLCLEKPGDSWLKTLEH